MAEYLSAFLPYCSNDMAESDMSVFNDVMLPVNRDSGCDTPSDSDDEFLHWKHSQFSCNATNPSDCVKAEPEDLFAPLPEVPFGQKIMEMDEPPLKKSKQDTHSTSTVTAMSAEQFLESLTAEERAIMKADGITLPSSGVLSVAQERELKRLRRKIKNKISAKDSRRRRKEYITQLEEDNQTLRTELENVKQKNQSLTSQVNHLMDILSPTRSVKNKAYAVMIVMLALSSANVSDASTELVKAGHSWSSCLNTNVLRADPKQSNSVLEAVKHTEFWNQFNPIANIEAVDVSAFQIENAGYKEPIPDLIPASLVKELLSSRALEASSPTALT